MYADINVPTVWEWCRDAYLRLCGRRLEFPADTDRTKTYQWRYVTALCCKFQGWGFDARLCRQFIDVAVAYAAKKRLLHKGLAIFHQSNLVAACYARTKTDAINKTNLLASIGKAREWLTATVGANDLVAALLTRPNIGANCNIVSWYRTGALPEAYLVLSRACGAAMARLTADYNERQLLPTPTRIVGLRATYLDSASTRCALRAAIYPDRLINQ